MVESASDVIAFVGADGRIAYVSPSAAEVLGLSPTELIGRSTRSLLRRAEARPPAREWADPGAHGQDRRVVFRHTDGERRVLEVRAGPLGRDGTVVIARDVTERSAAEDALRAAALRDDLTGLANRTLFLERLAHEVKRLEREQEHGFAVLFLDLDRFKVINDSLGHSVGDRLLRLVARRLQGCVRPGDTVARFGGDEFALLLEGVAELGDATAVAQRIATALSRPVDLDGYEAFTAASIGIVLSSSPTDSAEALLRSADMAMYRAKAGGRGRFEVFDRAMHAEALRRLQLETDLRRALDRAELRLAFQPVVSYATGRVSGFEALVRWKHPEHGEIAPDQFLPVAEETNLILPLGEWVLAEACRQLGAWQERLRRPEGLTMAVNLSARQFSQPDLAQQVEGVIAEAGLRPGSLHLEITESAVIERKALAVRALEPLRARGVRVHMDDFGTGYSSLSYLHQLPLDAIKIDRSFVGRMEEDRNALQVVRTIVALAHGFGLGVVAEGVETRAQFEQLRALGCTSAQGYFLSRPLSATDAEELLGRDPAW